MAGEWLQEGGAAGQLRGQHGGTETTGMRGAGLSGASMETPPPLVLRGAVCATAHAWLLVGRAWVE